MDLDSVLSEVRRVFKISGRFNVRKVVVVIFDSGFDSSYGDVKVEVDCFVEDDIKLISVVIGKDVDFKELVEFIFYEVIEIIIDEDLKEFGEKIMILVLKGK